VARAAKARSLGQSRRIDSRVAIKRIIFNLGFESR
jgi:hypothetical protein